MEAAIINIGRLLFHKHSRWFEGDVNSENESTLEGFAPLNRHRAALNLNLLAGFEHKTLTHLEGL